LAFTKISNDVISLAFTVTHVGTTVASGATGSYTIPAGAVWVIENSFHNLSSGSRIAVNIKNSSGTTLHTYTLNGGNELSGTTGNGVNVSHRGGFLISIPSTAAGGTLEFFRQSGGSTNYIVTVNQIVTTA
jgi:hypothetical protein